MAQKHSLIVLLIFFLYLPLSLAQQISLEKAINLFENIREKKNIKINFKESFIEIIFCFLVP